MFSALKEMKTELLNALPKCVLMGYGGWTLPGVFE
jgi:hypothetical protein